MTSTKAPSIKETKDGKLSFRLPDDLKQILQLAITYRMEHDMVQEYLHHLLHEAKESLQKAGKVKMRKSEFFAVFHPEQMRYVERSTINLLRYHIGEYMPTEQNAIARYELREFDEQYEPDEELEERLKNPIRQPFK